MNASGSKSPKSPLKMKSPMFGERKERKRHPSEGASRWVEHTVLWLFVIMTDTLQTHVHVCTFMHASFLAQVFQIN